MFDVFIKTHFSAGHHLRNYPGNCERPHGHNWNVTVTVRATKLDELGMGIDFRTVKTAVNKVMEELDHCDLNNLPAFLDQNPSSLSATTTCSLSTTATSYQLSATATGPKLSTTTTSSKLSTTKTSSKLSTTTARF